MLVWMIAIAMVLLTLVSFALDPRKLRVGIFLFTSLSIIALSIVRLVVRQLDTDGYPELAAWFLLGLVAVAFLTLVALAVFLIYNGMVMLRREARRLPNLLSLMLGIALICYVALGIIGVFTGNERLGIWVLFSIPPAGYLGFVFAAFILYSWLYGVWARQYGGPVGTVIVLGAGLAGDRVTPLLASRLATGQQVMNRSLDLGAATSIVVSGGKGADEAVSEAQAMAAWLLDHGTAAGSVLLEGESRNTYENLLFSRRLLESQNMTGRVAVVTSNFHAFRAATLMRKVGIPGYSIGAPTARYYWPTAIIREFIAILRDHAILNATIIAGLCLPLMGFLVSSLII